MAGRELSKEERERLDYLDSKSSIIKSTDDWEKVWEPGMKNQRYGMAFYSKKLDKLRGPTFSEFYGNGIVD